jgi:hypothetical protein
VGSVPGFTLPSNNVVKKNEDSFYNLSIVNSDLEKYTTNPQKISIVHGQDELRFKLGSWLTNNDLRYFFLDAMTSQANL